MLQVTTEVTYRSGLLTWLLVILILCLGLESVAKLSLLSLFLTLMFSSKTNHDITYNGVTV